MARKKTDGLSKAGKRSSLARSRLTSGQQAEYDTKIRLSKPVAFRLTDADHAAYLAKVKASGLTPSEFFRNAVLTNRTQIVARPKASPERGRLLYLFNKTSNNINQLAYRANADHLAGVVSEDTYSRILADLHGLAHYMKAAIKDVG